MRKIVLALIAAIVLAAPASAAPYLFRVGLFDASGVSRPAYSFTIDSAPTPASFDATSGFSYFRIADVAIGTDPAFSPAPASPADLLFFDQITGGAFSTADFVMISYFGTQLFDGAVSAPTFLPGTTDLYGASGDVVGAISITQAAPVPEAATWAMMIGGLGLIGGVFRGQARRRLA
jgi:hypothetical protein